MFVSIILANMGFAPVSTPAGRAGHDTRHFPPVAIIVPHLPLECQREILILMRQYQLAVLLQAWSESEAIAHSKPNVAVRADPAWRCVRHGPLLPGL